MIGLAKKWRNVLCFILPTRIEWGSSMMRGGNKQVWLLICTHTNPPKNIFSGFWNSVISLFCWVKLSMYIFESGSRLPFIITFPLPLLRLSTVFSLNMSWHTRSKKFPIDSKTLMRPGKRCAFRASTVRSFLESRAMWVDVTISPFGIRMGSGLIASYLL